MYTCTYMCVCVFLRNCLHAHTFKNYYQVQVSDERVDAKPTDILVINVTTTIIVSTN